MNHLPLPARDQHPEPPSSTSSADGPATRASRGPRAALGTVLVTALIGLALVGSAAAPASAGLVRTAAPTMATAAGAPTQATGILARSSKPRGAHFQLATFNVLGSNHTRNSRRYARGTSRARTTAGYIKQRGTDVINLQEVQKDQLRVLKRRLGGWRIWPQHRLGNQGYRLQIAWRDRRFKKVDHGHINTYFHRQMRPIPWVKLKDRRTNARFYVINIHNSPGRMERARDRATRQEIGLIKRLRRSRLPVFIAGDANEHFEFFCKVGRATPLRAPQGGNPDARPCRKPRKPRLLIDWIMGGGGYVKFKWYSQRRDRAVRRSSDHHYVQTTVRVARGRR